MTNHINFSCACGTVKGALRNVSPENGARYICYCDDCQAFAQFLKCADRALDANGGTDAFQTAASRFEITQGKEHLACVHMTSKPLLRWYADCCKTPLVNTYSTSKASFLSVILYSFDEPSRDAVLGPVQGHVWKKFAWGDVRDKKPYNILKMIARMLGRIVSARASGDYKNTPLFERETCKPIAKPYFLSTRERSEINASRRQPTD